MSVISFIFDPRVLTLLGFTIIAIIVAITLILYERKQNAKIVIKRPENSQLIELKKLFSSSKTSEEKLAEINKLSKQFFKEKFNLSHDLTYTELKQEFLNKKMPEFVYFSNLMVEAYYSDESISKERINEMLKAIVSGINKLETQVPKEQKKSIFSFLTTKKQNIIEKNENPKYFTSKKESLKPLKLPAKEEKKIEIKKIEKIKSEEKILHGKTDEDEQTHFIHHKHFSKARQNFDDAKLRVKKIHTKLESSKSSSLKENSNASEMVDDLENIKSKIEDTYKNILNKI
jgi:flagellin-like hook-associated protein FlgL